MFHITHSFLLIWCVYGNAFSPRENAGVIMADKKLVGKISHYYDKIGVALVELTSDLKVGDKISIEGNKTNFQQKVESMQIEQDKLESAKAGDSIGMKVSEKVRDNDQVFKVTA